jgi:transcriptional regulator with XRE-family HTH domain
MRSQTKQYGVSPATQARLAAGYSVAEAARRAEISEGYLRRIEREGAPYLVARRLSRLYQCPAEVFLPEKPRKEGNRKH